MTYRNPLHSYRQVSTATASPGQLVLMLYDGAIKFLECALSGFQFDDPLEFNRTISNNVVRAKQILNELNSSLDLERGGEIATTLRSLYAYMDRLLTQSNNQKTREGIEESIRHLAVLRGAWSEMLANVARESSPAPANLCACG